MTEPGSFHPVVEPASTEPVTTESEWSPPVSAESTWPEPAAPTESNALERTWAEPALPADVAVPVMPHQYAPDQYSPAQYPPHQLAPHQPSPALLAPTTVAPQVPDPAAVTAIPYQPGFPVPSYGQPGYGQPGYGHPVFGQPAYVTPPKRRYAMGALVVVGAVTALVCGVGGAVIGGVAVAGRDSNKAQPHAASIATGVPTATDDPTPAVDPTGTSRTVDVDGPALLAMIPRGPAGSKVRTVPGTSGGVMSLSQYLKVFFPSSTIEKGWLQDHGFKVAAIRDYTTHGVQYATHLVEFDDPDGADSYVLSQIDARTVKQDFSSSFDIPGADEGKAFLMTKLDKLGNRRLSLYAQVGNVAVVISVFTPNTVNKAAALKVMAAQVAAIK